MIGYKATDENGDCRGFHFEVGKTYTKDTPKEELECCTDKVFHFCRKLEDCFNYYNIDSSRVFEVIAGDYVILGDKCGTNSLTILRELTKEEIKLFVNIGKYNIGNHNSGNCNSGSCNSGNCNSGSCNSGDWNSGNCNSGDWNSGNYNIGNYNSGNFNSGFFNSNTPKLRMFNKETSLDMNDIHIPYWCYICLNKLNSYDAVTNEEIKEHELEIKTCGGFLKIINYKEAWRLAYDKTSDYEKLELFKLPNYDCKVFEEITGIDTTQDYTRLINNED